MSAEGFESFPLPQPYGDDSALGDSLASKVKRFFSVASGPSTPALSSPAHSSTAASPLPPQATLSAAAGLGEAVSGVSSPTGKRSVSIGPTDAPPPTRTHSRNVSGVPPSALEGAAPRLERLLERDARSVTSSTHSASASVAKESSVGAKAPAPGTITTRFAEPPDDDDGFVKPRDYVRPTKLSGVSPVVRLSRTNSNRGDLSSSVRSTASDKYALEVVPSSSPTDWQHPFAHLAGFPLGRDTDDSRSIRSVASVVSKPQITLAQILGRMGGQGLSKEYWIKDESSRECFDCHSIFTAFRRKHHCRLCGQIFCATCASNVIPSDRFGHNGYLRVCNICLEALESDVVEEARQQARGAARGSSPLVISAPIEASARRPQPQFAASHLFPRSETPLALRREDTFGRSDPGSPRDNASVVVDDEEEGVPSPPLMMRLDSETSQKRNVAPFRRAISEDDDKPARSVAPNEEQDEAEEGPAEATPPPQEERKIAFPLQRPWPRSRHNSNAADRVESRASLARTERVDSRASFGRMRSMSSPTRAPSPLLASEMLDAASLSLAPSAIQHLRAMLHQMLQVANMPNLQAWEKTIIRLLANKMHYPRPNVSLGDSMDVRRYIKIKKVPGGRPRDSEYVDGVVFTKNVLHKEMARSIANPKIMLLSFPLEYERARVQYMSLEPVMQQETEYLGNLVARIIARRPQVVLVQQNVSRTAIEYLTRARVAVARNVGAAVIEQVARATQADVITSIDKLALEPRFGRCRAFRVQTIMHPAIPGRKKTLMRFEGCPRELACSILLRGAGLDELRQIKEVVKTMLLAVYSAKLESHLLHDEQAAVDITDLPPHQELELEPQQLASLAINVSSEDPEEKLTSSIRRALQPFEVAALSSSPTVHYPPPYPLLRMYEDDRKLVSIRRLKEYEEMERIIIEEEASRRASVTNESISQSSSSTSLTAVPASSLATPEDAMKLLKAPSDLSKESQYNDALRRHTRDLQMWKHHLLRQPDSLDPAEHQSIFVLEALGCTHTTRPCDTPKIREVTFYSSSDLTIAQYIQGLCDHAGRPCVAKACESPMLAHYKTWAHGSQRVTIVPEVHQVDLQDPAFASRIIMWSYCKICKQATPQEPMSDDTCRFSFFKFLELCFYPEHLMSPCGHNAHLDQVRYWALGGVCLLVSVDRIEVFDVVAPPLEVRVKAEKQLQLRNEEYALVLRKNTAFWDSIAARIVAFNYELVHVEKADAARQTMEEMTRKSETERIAMLQQLGRTYEETHGTNGIETTVLHRMLQNKAAEWDAEFQAFEQRFVPADKDARRLTANQLKRLFSEPSGMPTSPDRRSMSSGFLSPSTEADESEKGLAIPEASIGLPALFVPSFATAKMPTTVVGPKTADAALAASELAASGAIPLCVAAAAAASSESPSAPPSEAPSETGSVASSEVATPAESEAESDSTVHADAPGGSLAPPSEGAGPNESAVSDGFAEGAPDEGVRRSRLSAGIAEAVKRFDGISSERPPLSTSPSASRLPVPVRPCLRRGLSDRTQSTTSRPESPNKTSSDGDEQRLLSPTRGWRGLASNRGSDRRKSSEERRPTTSSDEQGPSRQPRTGKPSAMLGKACEERPPLVSQSSSRSTIKGKARADSRQGRAKASKASRPSSISRASTSKRNGSTISTGNRVFTIARHFDRLSREAESSRFFRGKRARPVGTAQPTIRIFQNARDAVKKVDSDEEDDGRSSVGADDEFDERDREDEAGEQSAVDTAPAAIERQLSQKYKEPKATPTSMIDAMLHRAEASPRSRSPAIRQAPPAPPPAIANLTLEDSTDSSAPSAATSPAKPGQSAIQQRLTSDSEHSGTERSGSIMKTLSNLWSYRGCDFTPLEYPLSLSEHVFVDNPILVREDEPSSIIAHILSSQRYREYLDKLRVSQRTESFMPDDSRSFDDKASWDIVDVDDKGVDKEIGGHFEIEFVDGSTKFSCNIFFAEQFDALRKQCGCDQQIIQSLARCEMYDSSGGKSRVDFLRTKDDRFLLKELTSAEFDSISRFAPAYFEYMSKALFGGLPTALAKIFGIFRISMRKPSNGKDIKGLTLFVMENLFYGRTTSQVFDLKGSLRNRFVRASPDKPNVVLQDENLCELMVKDPVYVREPSKRFMRAAIHNDTLFLANLNVMDYSLVIARSTNGELLVGVIDFIRTYTWDKRVETWMKDSGLLGGGSSKSGPTVITPKLYKQRFRDAMEEYLFLVPTPWLSRSAIRNPWSGNAAAGGASGGATTTGAVGQVGAGSTLSAISVAGTVPTHGSTLTAGGGGGASGTASKEGGALSNGGGGVTGTGGNAGNTRGGGGNTGGGDGSGGKPETYVGANLEPIVLLSGEGLEEQQRQLQHQHAPSVATTTLDSVSSAPTAAARV